MCENVGSCDRPCRDGIKHMFVYLSAKMPKGKQVCAQTKTVLLECTIILTTSSNVVAIKVR